jgi:hypothetical protein
VSRLALKNSGHVLVNKDQNVRPTAQHPGRRLMNRAMAWTGWIAEIPVAAHQRHYF